MLPLDRLKSWNDARRLERIRAEVAMVTEGRALLALAARLNCEINFNEDINPARSGQIRFLNKVVAGKDGSAKLVGKPRYVIDLNRKTSTAKLVTTLAHELRHLWQYQIFPPARTIGLTAKLQLVYTRVVEGDAFAFQNYFTQRLVEKKTGGAAQNFDWQDSFTRFQKTFGADYDAEKIEPYTKMLVETKAMFDGAGATASQRQTSYAAVFNRSATAELKGLADILRSGFSPQEPLYITYKSTSDMTAKLLASATPAMRRKAQAIDKTLRTGG